MARFDVSASGLTARLTASKTFPQGFQLSAFADDTDPFDVPEIALAEATMNINGDLVTSSTPTPLSITVAVLPNSDEDKNLRALGEQNRAGKGRRVAGDVINIVASYADGRTFRFIDGVMTATVPSASAASGGRIKTPTYTFAFADIKIDD